MEFKTHWRYDDFYPDAHVMRKVIDDHFTESVAGKVPFNQRAIWNYWFIPTLYMYFRAQPWVLMPEPVFEGFMSHLRAFAARQFGLVIPTKPFISMYVNGCGQNIHNDFKNGRLAYVFSLTKWAERKFLGGETFIYHVGDKSKERFLQSTGGWGWYDFVEPVFNRLALFDDRMPHAVNFIQGTMDPLDARFALHGHMEEPLTVGYVEGGLSGADLSAHYDPLRNAISSMFQSLSLDGFISAALTVEPSGATSKVDIRCMQLVDTSKESQNIAVATERAKEMLAGAKWPSAASASILVVAIGAAALKERPPRT